jgi:DNA-binding NarL/FixJ family response regulator
MKERGDNLITPETTPVTTHEALGRKFSVLLVDDHAIWRDGIRSLLEDTEFRVVGEASSGKDGVVIARTLQPQIVLMDIRMGGGDGLDALRTLKSQQPQTAVIMLTSYENSTYVSRAIAGGAAGYLLKGLKRDELMAALRAVANGEMLLSREDLAHSLRGLSETISVAQDLIQPLTEREIEVLRLMATGLCNREIGELLFVTENTIKTHVVHIIGKLGVSDRVQAAVWAARHGLLEA